MKAKKYAVILCGGGGLRSGLDFNKVLFPIGQKNVLETCLDKFADFDLIVLAAAEKDFDVINSVGKKAGARTVLGGETRTQSVRNALKFLENLDGNKNSTVLIHDAARPFLSPDLIQRVAQSAEKNGSGIAAVKIIDSVKGASDGVITEPLKRENLYAVQTPQGFNLAQIVGAYKKIEGDFEDDSEVYRLAGFKPKIVEGEYANKKLTVPSDFLPYSGLIGTGFDVHQLVFGRKLILGGIEIPFAKGLEGHSDADVLLHAITDALLSAGGFGDIGVLFPDNDAKFKDIDSSILLDAAALKLKDKDVKINYISAVIIAQSPKMSPFIALMRQKIARVLGLEVEKINISATTTEFLGLVGEEKGIAASAVCLCGLCG